MSEKKRRSSVNSLKNSDGDKEKKSIKSEAMTEEDEELEQKPIVSSQSESAQASLSTERRSSRIMTRKQRHSELRLTFAKKLKTNPQGNSPLGNLRGLSKNPTRTPVRSSDLTSDSETPTSSKKFVKKPLVGNKRKSNLEYSKNQKRLRQNADTTTTDDNEDTEESDQKSKPNMTNVKKKLHLQGQNAKVSKLVKKRKDEFSDEETEVSDYKSNKPVQRKVPGKLMKEVVEISDDEMNGLEESRMKKRPMNAKVAKLLKKRKDEFSDETDDTSESDSDIALEKDLKKAISTKFPSYKTSTSSNSNKSRPTPNSTRKPTSTSMSAMKRPTIAQRTLLGKSNDISRNFSHIKTFTNSTKRINVDYRQNVEISPFSKSEQKKTEFDKLVDELFEEDATRKRKEPTFMIINNEPTDVYTLCIDDTLDEDDDLENLESLCEEVEEDVHEEDALQPETNPMLSFSPNLGLKPKIFDNNKPLGSPLASNSLKKEIYKPETKIHLNNISYTHLPQTPTQNKTRTLELPKKPATPSYSMNNVKSSHSSKPVKQPEKQSLELNVDYKDKYDKLLTSYEALSKKIAQYMDKTNKEKEALKRQLKLEKSKCTKAHDDLDILKRKFQYLMNNRPGVKRKT